MTLSPQFSAYLTEAIGSDEAATLIGTISQGEPATSLRINPAKSATLDLLAADAGKVAWHNRGHYLASRPKFTFDPALHQGLYYVQEPSSMFAGHVAAELVRHLPDCRLKVLDACAAPGGKTTAIADELTSGSTVVANEFDRSRSAVLAENIAKWGNPAVIVTQGDTSRFRKMRGTFDIVMVDAPCSGEGMMRKDAKAVEQWSEALVAQCVARQKEILENLADTVTPGGYLIYSTCTFNRHENEEIIDWLISSYDFQPVNIPINPSWGIVTTEASGVCCHRFLPSHLRGEGLFMAVMQRPGAHVASATASSRHQKDKAIAEVAAWTPTLTTFSYSDNIWALPAASLSVLKELEKTGISIVAPGVAVASVKGRDFIPAAPLALSTALDPGAFPMVEISRDEALDYLRRDAISLPSGTPRGHVLLTHNSYPLGFVKNLGNRANNLYPIHWRIRSAVTD